MNAVGLNKNLTILTIRVDNLFIILLARMMVGKHFAS